MQVKFGPIRNIEEVQAFIKSLPRGTVRDGLRAFVKYVLGDKRHGLRHDEPQKYVSRKRAGYKTSAAQWRYMFAVGILENDGQGGIKLNRYKRTGKTAEAWTATETNNGYNASVSNNKIGAYYTRDMEGRTRQHELAGRRNVLEVIQANLDGAMRSAVAAVNAWLRGRQ